ncbi:hypothetical protein [Phormidium sp. FACHB-1136]|uniref:hypothetical protein n=1 Tax=Phormidium sp. FACHB-1136 TaxID=2692848 RepID=UPI001683150F|nr:hypothetical protein [Phormidium sp. FACHB-1136]MBD2427984.1 hypothetical protein [Phormidium sp. FACHB-1136]
MPKIKRRHFLQAAGSSLAAIGLSQTGFLGQVQQYNRAGSALIYGSEKKQPKTAIYCRKVSRVA